MEKLWDKRCWQKCRIQFDISVCVMNYWRNAAWCVDLSCNLRVLKDRWPTLLVYLNPILCDSLSDLWGELWRGLYFYHITDAYWTFRSACFGSCYSFKIIGTLTGLTHLQWTQYHYFKHDFTIYYTAAVMRNISDFNQLLDPWKEGH